MINEICIDLDTKKLELIEVFRLDINSNFSNDSVLTDILNLVNKESIKYEILVDSDSKLVYLTVKTEKSYYKLLDLVSNRLEYFKKLYND